VKCFRKSLGKGVLMKISTDTVEVGKWYRKYLEGGISSNGKPYSIAFRKGTTNKLLVWLTNAIFTKNAFS